MIDVGHSLLLIAVMSAVTQLLRFLPFGLFARGTPGPVLYLGKVLPASIMAMLVVYCLRNTRISEAPHGLPEAVAVLLVVLLHKWKHNTLLSILAGTLCYMFLVQTF
ncbi:MAG: AzlD domain-containing protein [Candidatus Limivivens sp.]|nr:AzlD domain-containing protein [Candidatus Limivivens sp.]